MKKKKKLKGERQTKSNIIMNQMDVGKIDHVNVSNTNTELKFLLAAVQCRINNVKTQS